MSYCPQCGAEAPEGATFCGVCGTQLSAPSYDATLDQESNPYAVGAQTDAYNSDAHFYEGAPLKPTFGETFKLCCVKKFCSFQGRACRREYWFFVLWCFIINFAISMVAGVLGGILSASGALSASSANMVANVLKAPFGLYVLLPSLALLVRRFHDVNLPTWTAVFSFIAQNLALIAIPILTVTLVLSKAVGPRPADNVMLSDLAPIFVAVGVFFFFALVNFVVSVIPGSREPNKYGLPPVERRF